MNLFICLERIIDDLQNILQENNHMNLTEKY